MLSNEHARIFVCNIMIGKSWKLRGVKEHYGSK